MNEMNLKEIGERIKEMREISGKTIADMAKVWEHSTIAWIYHIAYPVANPISIAV